MDFSKKLEDFGVSRIIYTDINRDGTKIGINFHQIKKIVSKVNISLVVSGGISNIKDIKKLYHIKKLEGVIIGRAIYDGSIKSNNLLKLKSINFDE